MRDWREDALKHALRDFPREAVGLVIADGSKAVYRPCRNMARGDDHFVLPAEDYAAAEDAGQIIAVFHSHPNASCHPSEADRVACEASGLPWHIVGVPSRLWGYCEPCGFRLPLVGRTFSHGVVDCWACVRDGMAELAGVTDIPDFHRADDWWKRGGNLYMENFEAAGFVRVDRDRGFVLRPFDVILMQVQSPVANHAALHLGDGVILHHLHGRLSCKDRYGGYWRRVTVAVVRHRSLVGAGNA